MNSQGSIDLGNSHYFSHLGQVPVIFNQDLIAPAAQKTVQPTYNHQTYPPAPVDPAKRSEQIKAWANVHKAYTHLIEAATERGLKHIRMPNVQVVSSLIDYSIKAQNSLVTRGLLFTGRICRAVSLPFKIIAALFGMGCLINCAALPLTLPKVVLYGVLALSAAAGCAVLQLLAKAADKAATVWINSYFSEEETKELNNLRKFYHMPYVSGTQNCLDTFDKAHAIAKQIDAEMPEDTKRYEWYYMDTLSNASLYSSLLKSHGDLQTSLLKDSSKLPLLMRLIAN